MNKVSDYSSQIEIAIRALSLPEGDLSGLYEPISYALSAGGKRLRPALCLMTTEAFGGSVESAMRPALGLEMFHNFTLLHDDVMDNSEMRRGRQSVHAKWDLNHAILSGDTMLTLATQLISEVDDSKLRRVLDVFNRMAIKVYEGQQLDMDFEIREDVSLEEYIRMIGDKTGALLGAACEIGSIIGGATPEESALMYDYGWLLGVAFQIQDDWLDVYGDASTFGKPIGGDINNNKKSYLMLSGLSDNSAESEALRQALKMPASEGKIKVVTRLYDKLELSEKCRKAIEEYSSQALSALKKTGMRSVALERFKELTDKLTGRKR